MLLIMFQTVEAQKIIERIDSDEGITLLTSSVPIQLDPYLFNLNATSFVPKDTNYYPIFALSFFYKTPKEITLDSSAEIEIRFSDGTFIT